MVPFSLSSPLSLSSFFPRSSTREPVHRPSSRMKYILQSTNLNDRARIKELKLRCFLRLERLERSPEEDYTLNFEESVMSSHTATDDEIDFRMILPSESHRRRSLGKTGRSGSIASDQGTVSYSSVSMQTCAKY